MNWNVASGQLPQDVMHILYEGVLQLNITLMLEKFVYQDHLFTLEDLNDRIANFPYGSYEARNKPSKGLDQNHLKGRTKLPFSNISHNYMHTRCGHLQLFFLS